MPGLGTYPTQARTFLTCTDRHRLRLAVGTPHINESGFHYR
jgi:hypothetical protein